MSDRLNQVTAAILMGGLGTRLRPVAPEYQKTVMPVAGQPFVMRLLDQLADAGLRHVVLCTGYKAKQVESLIGNHHRCLSIAYSQETSPLGTAGALRNALPLLDSNPVLALNGDSYCELDLAAFHAAHGRRNATLAVTEVADTSRFGRVAFDKHGVISGFIEKGDATGTGWINAGVYLMGRALLESIPTGRAVSIEREIFPAWIGRDLYAFRTCGKFVDIGTPDSYAVAQNFFS